MAITDPDPGKLKFRTREDFVPKMSYVDGGTPGVNDDETLGYSCGSFYIDPNGKNVYLCTDATTGAANWVKTTLTW